MKDPILVLDTSICVDLSNGGLLECVLQLPWTCLLPDVIAAELIEPQGDKLVQMGYGVVSLSPTQIEYVDKLSRIYTKPSRNDLFALASAKHRSCILLTGDQSLRNAASVETVEVHGVLWLLDKLVSKCIISPDYAVQALNKIIEAGSWLPPKEVERRLKLWRNNIHHRGKK